MARTVQRTYLFADLRDYTAFVQAQGDAAATRLIRGFRRIVREAISRHRGAEIHTEGDSFYVVFPTPASAVRAAMAMQRGCRAHNDARPDRLIRAGIGINTGEAVVLDHGYVGSAVIVAARLASQAPAGTIVVTDTVRAMMRTGRPATLRDLGPWTLKGIEDPVHVHEVELLGAPSSFGVLALPALLRPTPSTPSAGVLVCPSIVGRQRELADLDEHLKATARGEPRPVLLVGDAGVGKSRLTREVAERAAARRFAVLAGRAHGKGSLPYEAIVAALRPYIRARGPEILRRSLGPLAAELLRLAPEIRLDATVPNVGDVERRDRFYRAVQLVLEEAAAQRPVLLVVEDLHEADAGTRDVLTYLVANGRAGVCTILTCRSEAIASDADRRELLGELDHDRRLARIDVRPLDKAGVTEMARLMLPNATTDLAVAVHERSGGVPFYVEELLKTAVDRGTLDRNELPRGIRDAVNLRVERLSQSRGPGIARQLELIALAGVPLSYDVLARLDGRHEETVGADLAAAVDAQLLERAATQRPIYQFRHPLTRDAIAARVSPERRSDLHRHIAESLEREGASPSAFLAHQFAAAGVGQKAVAHGLAAARSALDSGAYAAAISALEKAEGCTASSEERAEVLEFLGRALHAAGRVEEAEAVLQRARQEALGRGDLASAARIDIAIARAARALGRRNDAERSLANAMPVLVGRDRADALIVASEIAWAVNDTPRAMSLAQEAHDLATAAGDRSLAVKALTALGSAAARERRAGASETLERAIAAAGTGLPAEATAAWFELSRTHLLRGDFDAAAGAARSGLAIAREHGLEVLQARLLAQLTTIHINHGEYARARETAEQAVALARAGTLAADAARISLGHVLANQAEFEAALGIFDELAHRARGWDVDRQITYHAFHAQALLGARRLAAADRAARQAITLTLANPGMGMTGFLNAAAVVEARRDLTAARELATTFERYFAGRSTGPIEAVRLEIAAVVEWCARRPAAVAFIRAAEAYEGIGAHVHALYRRASAAIGQVESGQQRAEARRELHALRARLRERGALRYSALIDDALKRPRARQRSRPLLSRSDLRVAVLLARGASDARIARDIGVAQSEATRRRRSVLRALGVESSSQVASWAIARVPLRRGATPR